MILDIPVIKTRLALLGCDRPGATDLEKQARTALYEAAYKFLEHAPDDADVGRVISAIDSLESAAHKFGVAAELGDLNQQQKRTKTSD